MPAAEERSRINRMHISTPSKVWLRGNLPSRVNSTKYLEALRKCIEHERFENNKLGELELSEIRLGIMRSCPIPRPFPDHKLTELEDRIHNLRIDLKVEPKSGKRAKPTVQQQRGGIPVTDMGSSSYGSSGRRPRKISGW